MTVKNLFMCLLVFLSPFVGASELESDVFSTPRDKIWHVEENGNDTGEGTRSDPLGSLQEAFARAEQAYLEGKHVAIIVGKGEFLLRDSAVFDPGFKETVLGSLIVEGQGADDTLFTGAESSVGSDWERVDNGLYRKAFPYDIGTHDGYWEKWHANPEDLHAYQGEIVTVEGRFIVQTLSRDELEAMGPGAFYLDREEKYLYLRPLPTREWAKAVVKVAIAPGMGVRKNLITFRSGQNLMMRDFGVRQSATRFVDGAIGIASGDWEKPLRNIRMENIHAIGNNGSGIKISECDQITIRNCVVAQNGSSGFAIRAVTNLVITDCEARHNGWRLGDYAGYHGWAFAGAKIVRAHGVKIDGFRCLHNTLHGLWFDVDVRDVNVKNLTSVGNVEIGLYLELSPGPIVVEDSIIAYNRGVGIHWAAVRAVTLRRNAIFGNSVQINNRTDHRRSQPNWRTDEAVELAPQDFIYEGNLIAAKPTPEWNAFAFSFSHPYIRGEDFIPENNEGYLIRPVGFGDDWAVFLDIIKGGGNSYFHPTNPKPFYNAEGTALTIAEWNDLVATDPQANLDYPGAGPDLAFRLTDNTYADIDPAQWTISEWVDNEASYFFPGHSPENPLHHGPSPRWLPSGPSIRGVRTLPDTGISWSAADLYDSPKLTYNWYAEKPGPYELKIAGRGFGETSDAVFIAINGAILYNLKPIVFASNQSAEHTQEFQIVHPGLQTLDIWAAEDGVEIQSIHLSPSNVDKNSDSAKTNMHLFMMYPGLDTSTLRAPDIVKAVPLSHDAIYLQWIFDTRQRSFTNIERRRTDAENWTTVSTLGSHQQGYIDHGLEARSNYLYRLRTEQKNKQSAYSDPLRAKTLEAPPPPPPPESLSIEFVTGAIVELSWARVFEAEYYSVDIEVDDGIWKEIEGSIPGARPLYRLYYEPAYTSARLRVRSGNVSGLSASGPSIALTDWETPIRMEGENVPDLERIDDGDRLRVVNVNRIGDVLRIRDKNTLINFAADVKPGAYHIVLRIRSGGYGGGFDNANRYAVSVNGETVEMNPDVSTVTDIAQDKEFGFAAWGLLISEPVSITRGKASIEIFTEGRFLGIDYLELHPVKEDAL